MCVRGEAWEKRANINLCSGSLHPEDEDAYVSTLSETLELGKTSLEFFLGLM